MKQTSCRCTNEGRLLELEAQVTELEDRIQRAISGVDAEGEPFGGRTEHYEYMISVLKGSK